MKSHQRPPLVRCQYCEGLIRLSGNDFIGWLAKDTNGEQHTCEGFVAYWEQKRQQREVMKRTKRRRSVGPAP